MQTALQIISISLHEISSNAGQCSATSDATTVHYPLEAATRNALKGLSLKDPVTPVEKIRRTNTPVLTGEIGDRRLFSSEPTATGPTAAASKPATTTPGAKAAAVPKQTKAGKTSKQTKGKFKKGKSMKKSAKKNHLKVKGSQKKPKAAEAAPKGNARADGANASVPPAVPPTPPAPASLTSGPADNSQGAPARKATAAKALPKKAEGQGLPPCKLEKKSPSPTENGLKPPPTPHTVREERAAGAALAVNYQRATTQEQIGATAATQPSAPPAPPTPGSMSDSDDDEAPASPGPAPSQAPDAETLQNAFHYPAGSGSPEPQAEAGNNNKKKKKDPTPEQKAHHARYMRFSRSVRSILPW